MSDDDHHPVQKFWKTWVIRIMLPSALVAYHLTERWTMVVLATLSIPLLAILQGSLGILHFRINFGDAPLPHTPSHGVVVCTAAGAHESSSSSSSTKSPTSEPELLQKAAEQPPVRLLVIGDSLAIGVGQAHSATPVMPEVIAKNVSKKLGRVVYWTCHGAPGASTGWVVRELERGVDYLKKEESLLERQSSCSDTDDSSSDESSEACRSDLKVWRERLAHHRKRFNPDALGPYDIVVILTGSNDLKSAFFPFLLTGEDAEFRRQAKARGGSYTRELRLLLETLYSRMRLGLENIRMHVIESVEAATESVREKVEETMERITHRSFRKQERSPNKKDHPGSIQRGHSRHSPLVVLPGMPARALPIFRHVPLRWLSVPIVDIMDNHKRNLAKSSEDILFVPAPSDEELAEYENERGTLWRERCEEGTVFAVRDIRKRERLRIEGDMIDYYQTKGSKQRSIWAQLFGAPVGRPAFSVDGVHPNDQGYDFWGRHIARAIVEEWHDKNQ